MLGGVEAIGRASVRASENAHTLTARLFFPIDAHNKAQSWRVELTIWAQDRHRSFCGSSQNIVVSCGATPVQSMMKDGKKKCRRQGRKQGIYNGNSKHIEATCPRASTDAATCLNSNAGRPRFFTHADDQKSKIRRSEQLSRTSSNTFSFFSSNFCGKKKNQTQHKP